ncbi:MAG: N-acetylmuramoyl-L-alanine amidase, partial [Spirochaetales bacterium]
TAVEYALTGEASLNLLNVRDLAQVFGAGAFGIQGTGILELSLNRDKGLSMKTGMGGMDLSMSRMTDVVRSAGDWVKQQGIRLFDIFGSTDFAANYRGSKRAGTMLRANWVFGDAQAVKQVDDILIGETRLKAGYLGEGAETSLAEDGVRTVSLSSFGGQGDFDSRLLAGVILQHEAYRDGTADTDRRQYVETLNAVGAHTLMALSMAEEYGSSFILNNDTLRADAGALWSGFQSFANYTGQAYDRSGDYWRLSREGQLLYDGKADLFGEDGKLVLQDVNAKGVEGGLLEILGIDSSDRQAVEELRLQLVSAGLTYGVMDGADESESDNWYWNLGKNNQANMNRGIDAPAVLLDDLAFTGRFEEEDLYKVLLNRSEIPLSRTVTDNIGSFGYKFRALFSEDWADSWAVKKDGTRKMDYAEWRAFREGEYVKELLRTDLSISEDLLPAIPLIRPDERLAEMKGVIIHWTESTWGSSAQDTRDWFADQKIMASAHYSIGQDGEIIRMVPEDYIAWASGGVKPSALSGELFSGNPNNYTVSIESNPSYDRISFDENGLNISPGFLSRVNYDAMVKLTADILSRNNLSSSDLWRHYDMTGKDCPRYMQPDIFNRQGERIYNREWQDFRYRVQLLIDSIK